MEVIPGIHRIDGIKGAHAYLVLTPQPIIVDAGLPGQADKILRYGAQLNLAAKDIAYIILTHFDVDHAGSAAALQGLTGAQICAGAEEVPYLEGIIKRPGIKRYLPWLTMPVYGKLQNVHVDVSFSDDIDFAGVKILVTPGHTPGHICVGLGTTFLVGDLLQGGVREAPRLFMWNRAQAQQSIRKLAELNPELLLPGHGEPDFAPSAKLARLLTSLNA